MSGQQRLSAGKAAKIRAALFDAGRIDHARLLDVLAGGAIGECQPWLADLIRGALASPQARETAPAVRDYGVRKDGTPKGKSGRKAAMPAGATDLL